MLLSASRSAATVSKAPSNARPVSVPVRAVNRAARVRVNAEAGDKEGGRFDEEPITADHPYDPRPRERGHGVPPHKDTTNTGTAKERSSEGGSSGSSSPPVGEGASVSSPEGPSSEGGSSSNPGDGSSGGHTYGGSTGGGLSSGVASEPGQATGGIGQDLIGDHPEGDATIPAAAI